MCVVRIWVSYLYFCLILWGVYGTGIMGLYWNVRTSLELYSRIVPELYRDGTKMEM